MATLTAAQSIETLSFEIILQAQKDWLIAQDPALAQVLNIESETLLKMLENFAYRELYVRQRINNGIKATMISTATGSDLDNLLLLLGVSRLVLVAADASATPPVLAVLETDDNYRTRGLLVLESFSTAGPKLAYHYHALGVAGVVDVDASSPSAGVVDVVVVSAAGVANAALIALVVAALNDDSIRPLGTQLNVSSAAQVDYQVSAVLALDSTPAASLAHASARVALDKYIKARFKIGKDIQLSGIYAALNQDGVDGVTLSAPSANIVISDGQYGKATSISIT